MDFDFYFLYKVWLAVDVWLCTASILNLCCISLDRYLAITRPIQYPGLMSSRRAKTLVAMVWLFSFVIGCPPLIGWNDSFSDSLDLNETTVIPAVSTSVMITTQSTFIVCDSGNRVHVNMSCTETNVAFIINCELTNSKGYRIYAALGSFFIPMLVMVFFYLQIYRAAMRTISAYEKGELKTKYSGKEKTDGMKTNSVTLRIHRGGRSFSTSGNGNFPGSIHSGIGSNLAPAEGNSERYRDGRTLGRGEGFVGQTSIRKARSSDASLVTLTDLALENENYKINAPVEAVQKRCKSLCWNTERTCHECSNQHVLRGVSQNGRTAHTKLCSSQCMSLDLGESSSCDTGNRPPQASDHERASQHLSSPLIPYSSLPLTPQTSLPLTPRTSLPLTPQASLPLTPSVSCQNVDSGIGLARSASTSDHKRRKPRFSAQKPANAMKLHMQKFNREKKAAKTLAIIVGAFILCWMPFFTTYLVGAFCDNCVSPLVFSVAFWLGYCNSAMNPCVYALFSRDFRFAFRKLVTCSCQTWHTNGNFRPRTSDVPAIQLHCAPQDEARSSSDIEVQWR